MSNNELLKSRVSEDNLKQIFQAMINDSKNHAISLAGDDVMNESKYEEEKTKAKSILTGAIATILRNCELYGVDSIYQNDNTELNQKLECNTFFIELINEVCHESFNFKS